MANNGLAHSSQNVFFQQAHSTTKQHRPAAAPVPGDRRPQPASEARAVEFYVKPEAPRVPVGQAGERPLHHRGVVMLGQDQGGVHRQLASPSRVEQPLRGVRQDKGAPIGAPKASIQPAPITKVTRANLLDSNIIRSQNHSTGKRKSVKVTVWVKPEVKAEIARGAEQEGLSVSATSAAFLEEAIRQKLHVQHAVLLQPIIEQAIV